MYLDCFEALGFFHYDCDTISWNNCKIYAQTHELSWIGTEAQLNRQHTKFMLRHKNESPLMESQDKLKHSKMKGISTWSHKTKYSIQK